MRNKKWWDSWKNPRFFEKKFDSIFFSLFFRTREKSERFGQRERKSPERKRERERESVNLTRVCVLRSIVPSFEGEKNLHFTHTYIYHNTRTHIYIFKKKKTEMMASSQTLSFARAVAPSPRKLTRKIYPFLFKQEIFFDQKFPRRRSQSTSNTAKSETTSPALKCSSIKQTRRTRGSLLLP